MKKCKYCKTQYDNILDACPNCGSTSFYSAQELKAEEELRNRPTEVRNQIIVAQDLRKKRSRALLMAILGTGLVIAMVVYAFHLYQESKPLSNGLTKDEGEEVLSIGVAYLDSGEYESAVDCFLDLPSDSKQYEKAQSLLANGSYHSAIMSQVDAHVANQDYDAAYELIDSVRKVIPSDSDLDAAYDNVSSSYHTYALDRANSYIANGDYKVALEFLNSAKAKLPSDADLQELYASTLSTYKSIIRDEVLAQVGDCSTEADYESAIDKISTALNSVGDDDELLSVLNVYKQEYRDLILGQIDSVYAEGGYDSVLALLRKASRVLPDDSTLSQEYETWKTRSPILLTDLTNFSRDGMIGSSFFDDTDNYGTVYASCVSCNGSQKPDAEFFIDGQYAKLSGTLYITDHAKEQVSSGWLSKATFSVYGDDVLLYTFSGFDLKDKPFEFSVDISGVEFLKIEFANANYSDYNAMWHSMIAMGNATLGW